MSIVASFRPGQEQAAMKMLNRVLSGAVLAACLVSAGRAQVAVDVSKITCEQYVFLRSQTRNISRFG